MNRKIVINASPHVGQSEVHRHEARFKVLAAGRRWGKTRLGVNECFQVASVGGRAWWVAPSYRMSEVGWRPMRETAYKIGAEIRKVDRTISLPNGGSMAVRSADNPDSLRGESLDLVIADECAFMKEAAWIEALRPALADRKGRAIFISTPKGRNWFWRLYQMGLGQNEEYKSWQFKSSDNPFIDPNEIEAARISSPERIYRQEYLAEFLDDAGGVFRNVMACATAKEQDKPEENHNYVFGVDWGKLNDFTVISVIDVDTKELVKQDRFNKIDYNFQLERLKTLHEIFRPTMIYAERNSMGEALIDRLYSEGLPVTAMTTTNATKDAWIQSLSIAFEREEIKIINDPVLIGELQAFESTRLSSGLMRYAAPSGMNDDTVMSLAIGWQGADTGELYGGTF